METKELINADLILEWMKEQVEQKTQLSPSLYVDASAKLAVLIGDENNKLFILDHKLNQEKYKFMMTNETSVAKAELYMKTLDEYLEFRNQKAKIEQILEL